MPKKTTKVNKTDGKFAVIATGGKQYVVSVGDSVKIEKIKGSFAVGDKVVFDKVLLKGEGDNVTVGFPYIDGASVEAIIEKIDRSAKILVVKYKAKARQLTRNGHRQPFFEVKITEIK